MKGFLHLISRRAHALLLFLLLMPAGLAPALAQPDTDADPQFLIERIVVEGIQRDSARAIVASETRLREGQPYTEPALREAIYRVKRLPFVLDAEFSLRKGSERGNYELVITVEPTRPVFFLAQADAFYLPSDERFGRDAVQTSSYGSVGVRQFLGSQGLLFASVDKGERTAPAYRLGYTQYNPFGAGSYATVGGYWVSDDQGAYDQEASSLSLEVGIPIAANQSLRSVVSWDQGDSSFESQGPFFSSSRQETEGWSGALEWIHDTRDDPLFPSRGDRLTAHAGYGRNRSHNRYQADIFGEVETFEERLRQQSLYTWIDGIRYFRLTNRQSVSLEAFAGYQESEISGGSIRSYDGSSHAWDLAATAGHSVSLWGYEKTERIGDLRFESQLTVGYRDVRGGDFADSQTAARLSTGLVFRNAWGVVRANLSYTEEEL